MEISSVQHHQAMAAHLHEDMSCPKPQQQEAAHHEQQKKPRPQPEQSQKCPRCDSTNTKFCYYNNYSLSQPRYFCKGCRRYWTKGGSLRNVPVGGGCRKNKRSVSSSTTPNAKSQQEEDLTTPLLPAALPLPPLSFDPNDLTLASFANDASFLPATAAMSSSFLDILRNPTGMFQGNASYGFGADMASVSSGDAFMTTAMFPNFSSGLLSAGNEAAATMAAVAAEDDNNNKNLVLGLHQWDYINGDNAAGSWHGLINSSLM